MMCSWVTLERIAFRYSAFAFPFGPLLWSCQTASKSRSPFSADVCVLGLSTELLRGTSFPTILS